MFFKHSSNSLINNVCRFPNFNSNSLSSNNNLRETNIINAKFNVEFLDANVRFYGDTTSDEYTTTETENDSKHGLFSRIKSVVSPHTIINPLKYVFFCCNKTLPWFAINC